VGTITTLALVLLFWPVIGDLFDRARRMLGAPSGKAT
jgi:hypothetical protein